MPQKSGNNYGYLGWLRDFISCERKSQVKVCIVKHSEIYNGIDCFTGI